MSRAPRTPGVTGPYRFGEPLAAFTGGGFTAGREDIHGYGNSRAPGEFSKTEARASRIFVTRSCDLDGDSDGRHGQSAGRLRAGDGLHADLATGHDRQATCERGR